MADNNKKSLHIVMFPWVAFGHMIPFLELSKLISQKGHKISFISTPRNINRLPKLPPDLSSSITLVPIPLPKLAELPENAEATMDINDEQMDILKKAYDGLEPALTRFLEVSRPDWIIYDFAPYWLPPITTRLGISGGFFLLLSTWFLAFLGSTNDMISGSDYRTKPEDFMVPPKWVKFETNVAYRGFEAKWIVGASKSNESGYSDFYRAGKVIAGCETILLRDCYEFEPQWINLLEELHNTRVVPLGLMPPIVQDSNTDESWILIKNWLDYHNKGSVIYVAFGSEVTPTQDQLTELAHGLELSEVPFFWVLRKVPGSAESDLLRGFEERVSGRGMVWRSWAPQLNILSHESVGGFFTHCGWSSTVEGLMFGHPLVMLPFLVDQGLNSRIVTEKQLGLEVPRNEIDGSFTRNSISNSIKVVMVDNSGRKMREKAKEMAAVFGDRELHSRYIDNIIEFLENYRNLSRC